jgi:hypothetical protein
VAVEGPPSETAELARLARVAARQEQLALESAGEAAIQRAKAQLILSEKVAEVGEQRSRVEQLSREVAALKATRRYRLAGALSRPLDGLRRMAGRRGGHD